MKLPQIKLHTLLNELKTQNIKGNIRLLIEQSVKIAVSLLSRNYKFEVIKFSFLQISLTDLATDSITPLFIKDKFGELPLRKALLNWDKEITDEVPAYYFLSKIIGNRIEQEIAKKLKEADPFLGKILRSINHLVETNRINKAS